MRKLKKLGVCVCVAAVAIMSMALGVSAKDYDWYRVEKDSYVQEVSGSNKKYSSKKYSELLKKSQVTDPKSMYEDYDIQKFARQYIGNGRKVYDLKSLAENGLYSLKVSKNKAFNYGTLTTDDFKNPSFMTIDCKCSEKDFKAYIDYAGDDYEKVDSPSGTYIYNRTGEDNSEWELFFDPNSNFFELYIKYNK